MFRLHLNIGFEKAVNLILKKMNAGGYKIRRPPDFYDFTK